MYMRLCALFIECIACNYLDCIYYISITRVLKPIKMVQEIHDVRHRNGEMNSYLNCGDVFMHILRRI